MRSVLHVFALGLAMQSALAFAQDDTATEIRNEDISNERAWLEQQRKQKVEWIAEERAAANKLRDSITSGTHSAKLKRLTKRIALLRAYVDAEPNGKEWVERDIETAQKELDAENEIGAQLEIHRKRLHVLDRSLERIEKKLQTHETTSQ